MRIGLVDVDGHNCPNLPLMKLSAWHKLQGDEVEFAVPLFGHYDIVYKSKVFSSSPDDLSVYDADRIIYGGTGYAIQLGGGREHYDKSVDAPLPEAVEHIYPDYGLYPTLTHDTAYGFLTRGCPRACEFCIVSHKEGRRSVRVADLSEFWRGQKNIVLFDPNILACREWAVCLQQLADSGAYVDINQGLDARMLTEDKVMMLERIKMREIHFAWDRYEDREVILRGLRLFSSSFLHKPHGHNAIVYTIVNFDTTLEQDLERIDILRELGLWAYIMIYDKAHASPIYRRLQRWVNNRRLFAVCRSFQDYLNNNKLNKH